MRRLKILLFLIVFAFVLYAGEVNNIPFKGLIRSSFASLSESTPRTGIESGAAFGAVHSKIKPEALSRYPSDAPAPDIVLLQWTRIPGSVFYEIELLTREPENPNGISPSVFRYYSTRNVFNNGFSVDLSSYAGDHLFWRVRALNWDAKPIGVFSDAAPLYIDHNLTQILKPVANTGYREANVPMPLYPVYSWFPLYGATQYEVELTDAPPENPNGVLPSSHQLRLRTVRGAFDCYDEEALSEPGVYYWRVRGLDERGNPVGVFSDAEEFTVSLDAGSYAATVGDSITHGGGGMSYSPADCEYSYQTYLTFPTMNLGFSGDTSKTMLQRFESDVLPFQPRYLIIMDGTNSLRADVPASDVIDDLAVIRDECFANDIRPIFLTLPPINPENIQKAFNQETVPDWREKFAAVNAFIRRQPYYIDIEPFFIGPEFKLPSFWGIDGIHLDIDGKKLMAQIINDNWSTVTE
ncbi:MAG: GDSL-type esterase/lipase family protein [Syntrophomonadaceae bacterium]